MEFKLVKGVGKYSEGTACIMSAAVAYKRVLDGVDIGKATDKLDCVCPVIRAFLIRVNDSAIWSDDLHRTNVLLPLIPRIVGTNNPKLLLKRMFFLVNWAVKTIAPLILKEQGLKIHAEKLESLADIVDYKSSRIAQTVANAAADAAYDGDAAYKAAYDSDATYRAASAAADSAVYAATYAVYAVDAVVAVYADYPVYVVASVADVATNADLKKKIVVVEVVKILDQLLNIR